MYICVCTYVCVHMCVCLCVNMNLLLDWKECVGVQHLYLAIYQDEMYLHVVCLCVHEVACVPFVCVCVCMKLHVCPLCVFVCA